MAILPALATWGLEATPESVASSTKWDGETSMTYFTSRERDGFETLRL